LLRGAQLRYYAQYSAFTSNLASLDVDYTTPKFYDMAVAAPAYGNDNVIATATRNNTQNPGYGNYVLSIQVDGDITCSGAAGVCARLGY